MKSKVVEQETRSHRPHTSFLPEDRCLNATDSMTDFQNLRVILIGGSSHVGKSTLAQSLASELGWSYRSTDKLAKHPGRPWRTPPKTVPEHVAEHYLTLSVEELIADVIRHYRDNVWPLVEDIVTSHATNLSSDRL